MRRKYDLRKIKTGWTYDIKEICSLYILHPKTVHGWISNGLEPIEGSLNPYLIAGHVLRSFLEKKSEKRRCRLNAEQFYCVRCKAARLSRPESVQVIKTNTKLGHDKFSGRKTGICEVCGCHMNRLFSFYKDG